MSTKSKLIRELEKNKGKFISGQQLADNLRVSRTSVWKAIKELKGAGYPIEAVTNKGYMLLNESRVLSCEAIWEHLDPSVKPKSIHILKTVDSTSNEAKRLLMNGNEFGTVIFAEKQTGGRGRLGRGFSSPPGDSLYVSFILKPLLDVYDSLLITVAASVAVTRAIKKMSKVENKDYNPKIKWVNDIYSNDRKLCGILTEAVSDVENGQLQSIVLGIGINVNVDISSFPEEFRDIIGSMSISPGNRNLFAAYLINEVFLIQDELSEFRLNGKKEPSFMEEYREASLILDKDVFVIKGDQRQEAKALHIDGKGGLVVMYKNGDEEILNTGEISIRLNNK